MRRVYTNNRWLTLVAAAALASTGLMSDVRAQRGTPDPFIFDKNKSDEPPRLVAPDELTRPEANSGAIVIAQNDQPVPERFVGSWALLSFETLNQSGEFTARDMTGRLTYDGEGNMTAQLMPGGDYDTPTINGYYAYFGRYTVNAGDQSVTHHVEGSLISRWVGIDLVRYYEFDGDRLTLTLREDGVTTGKLVWRRLD